MRAIYNALGSHKRNGKRGGTYGFMADMRLRLNKKCRAYINAQYRADTGKRLSQVATPRRWALNSAYSKAFYSRNRQYGVTYYGRKLVLTVCDPYCVITCVDTHEVVGVMPLATDQRLHNLYF